MTFENIKEKLNVIESDRTLQNIIAQADARYILYNTGESRDNFPNYTINDEKLNLLAFQYLNLGCRFIENKFFKEGNMPLEKGAKILENCHGSSEVSSHLGNYYGLISSLAYYVCFQYSKAFILIRKIENDTVISKTISLFLSRNYDQLMTEINEILIDEEYDDNILSEATNQVKSSQKIYEIVIAKALRHFVTFFQTGDNRLLELAKAQLKILKEIAEIKREPDVWWVVRLLIIITDGISEASLWNSLGAYFNLDNNLPKKYIQALTYKNEGSIHELFITQRNALPKVLNRDNNGCVVSIPTSSGKTRIAEIAILDCLEKEKGSKVLYVAPFRSLAYEIENAFDEMFHTMGGSVSHLYGGSLFSKLDEKVIDESDIIIATPEKSKAILRANAEILNQVKLVVIDEGHLLGANQRFIVNEMFYEELKFYVKKNGGRFLLLSAVLPNAKDLAEWLSGSEENVYQENWRPSDERLGILQWNGNMVDLNWKSLDTERNSYNSRFIVKRELERLPRQRKTRYFPSNKNQAIAGTAHKLRSFGPVLIFVGQKRSVFTIAREYDKCIIDEEPFQFKNESDWKAFELACIESYGEESEWLYFARKGVFCHNADLMSDVRLPLERLMNKEKPRVIIATSTLGQGVNLGVSTVIFSTLYQARELISSRDFWNIAGRAGRAFVDHEGKILVALDTVGKDSRKISRERKLILNYFDKAKIDDAYSGCLALIKYFKTQSQSNGISFERLIELLADNNIAEIDDDTDDINDLLDWIDDGLLSIHSANNVETNNYDWTDEYFRKTLAYIQAENIKGISGEEVVQFLTARTKGIVTKVGDDKQRWASIIKSGIPLNSDLQIEEKLNAIIILIQSFLATDKTVDSKIDLLKNIEDEIKDINVLKDEFIESVDENEIRNNWIKAIPLSQIAALDEAIKIVSRYYAYTLPWVLNGISKKIKALGLIDESEVLEELSILVELGLPNLRGVKVYQAGIRSRSSANEIGQLFDDDTWERSIRSYKTDLIRNIHTYKVSLSEEASNWLDLLSNYSKRIDIVIKRIPNFTFGDHHKLKQRLIAKQINGKQYLLSPDSELIQEISNGDIDFSAINKINGIYFDFDQEQDAWVMNSLNPYLKFESD